MTTSEISSNDGLKLVRVYDGTICVAPPSAPILAEDVDETLLVVAGFVGMRRPRGREDTTGKQRRYQWAAENVLCPPGSQFMLVRLTRARDSEPAYLLTSFIPGAPAHIQMTAWSPMDVLVRVNHWLSTIPMNTVIPIHGIRIGSEIEPGEFGTFVVKVVATSTLPPHPEINSNAAWTLVCEEPPLRIALMDPHLVAYVKATLADAPDGFYLARIYHATLDLGQRVSNERNGD